MIICVTGTMASGKNAVCDILQNHNFYSIDLDVLVHDVINQAQNQLQALFEPIAKQKNLNIFNADGSLNRRIIGQLVFSDSDLLAKHENIVYPILIKNVLEIISQKKDQNIILNATVIYKTPQLLSLCTKVIFVTAPFFIRFFRCYKRDYLSFIQIIKRFNNQKKLYNIYKKQVPNIIKINNWGSFKLLNKKVLKSCLT